MAWGKKKRRERPFGVLPYYQYYCGSTKTRQQLQQRFICLQKTSLLLHLYLLVLKFVYTQEGKRDIVFFYELDEPALFGTQTPRFDSRCSESRKTCTCSSCDDVRLGGEREREREKHIHMRLYSSFLFFNHPVYVHIICMCIQCYSSVRNQTCSSVLPQPLPLGLRDIFNRIDRVLTLTSSEPAFTA